MSRDEVVLPLPTDTRHARIESRQYKLFVDLGDGVPRRKLTIGIGITLTCWVIVGGLFGVNPFGGQGAIPYVMLPAIVCFLAMRQDTGGRMQFTAWQQKLGYLLRRSRPIILSRFRPVSPSRPYTVGASWVVLDLKRMRSRKARQALAQALSDAAATGTPHLSVAKDPK